MGIKIVSYRYFIHLTYNGSAYHGWQRQSNTPNTVQGHLDQGLQLLLQLDKGTMGCGRTDAGVHAKGFVAHFDAPQFDIDRIVYKLNVILPSDIVVLKIEQKRPLQNGSLPHARFDAVERSYVYRLSKIKDPFTSHFVWKYPFGSTFDVALLHKTAHLVLKTVDFTSLSKKGSDNKTGNCIIKDCKWEYDPTSLIYEFHITSDRFLRGMIRLIVGMSINVMRGKLSYEEVESCLKEGKMLTINFSVPAHGLCLYGVKY